MTRAKVIETARTFLFVPGSRPERFAKAVASGADLVIIDLEDAVAADGKTAARTAAVPWLHTCAVRVNSARTPWFREDVEAARGAAAVVLPKAESAADIHAATAILGSDVPVVALIETPLGLQRAAEICACEAIVRVAFGNVDFAAEIGVNPSSHIALAAARSQLVYASAVAGCAPPIDGVTTALDGMDQLRADTAHARELGYTAKLLIHPRQVPSVAQLLSPTPAELEWAREVLMAAQDDTGVAVHNGQMIDEPVVRRARRLLEAART